MASLLALLALVTLVIKQLVEWQHARQRNTLAAVPPEPSAFLKEAA